MRSKTPLVLMEQLVMVLVFAMAAAMSLRVFAFSDRLSEKNTAVSQAAFLAQDTAERLKNSRGDILLEETAEGCWYFYYDENGQSISAEDIWTYRVAVRQEAPSVKGLRCVEIQVAGKEEEILFEIPVAWQEVSSHG